MTISKVEVSPEEVDAGAELTLDIEVSRSDGAGPAETRLLIRDHDGELAASVELAELDGETGRSGAFVVAAPLEPGTHAWSAAAAAPGSTPAPFSFTVRAHETRVLVWDAPPSVECGETFRVKLGARCARRCRPVGWTLEVRDHEQNTLATVRLEDQVWPHTDALYYADVKLRAPDREGLYRWEARATARGLDASHAASVAALNLRVMATPECVLTVEAVDAETQAPVKGAQVVVHPYRAFTDARGVAAVKVVEGEYRVFVSGKGHVPFRSHCMVNADMTIRAPLVLDREPSDAEIWS